MIKPHSGKVMYLVQKPKLVSLFDSGKLIANPHNTTKTFSFYTITASANILINILQIHVNILFKCFIHDSQNNT